MKGSWLLLFLVFTPLYGVTITSGPTTISAAGIPTNPQLAISAGGEAVSIWVQGFPGEVTAAYYNGTEWLSAVTLATGGFPQVSMDGSGNAIATWLDTSFFQIYIAQFDETTLTWGTPLQLTTGGTTVNAAPQISVNADGYALAVWIQAIPSNQLYASSYDVDTAKWSSPVALVTGSVGTPLVALDDSNDAVITYISAQSGIEALIVTVP